MSRCSARWLTGFAALVLLVAAGLYFFDWNMLRGPIERRVEHATGRAFAINGNLSVHLSLKPRVTAEGLVLGGASSRGPPPCKTLVA